MPRKILVADDSLTIQKVVELTFSAADYQLTCVANGRIALERVRDDPPDLILADVVMPEKNGYEVCEAIKRDPATAGIPVVLLAGTFEPFDRERADRLGCDAIVSKPFESHQLFRKVEELLGGRAPVAAAPPPDRPEPARETPVFTRVPPSPFAGGFADEDFTGSIRNLRGSASADALEGLYGPEDVETALAAFRAVEPAAAFAAQERATPVVDAPPAAADDGRTQRIDVSAYRAPRATDPIAPSAEAPTASDFGDDTAPMGQVSERIVSLSTPHPDPLPAGGERELADRSDRLPEHEREMYAEPLAAAEVREDARPEIVPPAPLLPARGGLDRELTDSEVERLAERIADKVIERLSDRVVREIAWEVVPETAELVVRERIRELESGVE
ncbi:MAG TPA: response regulator [Thermoanaerobaculia bacterium]|nr:response regulator [Thermoanaerobaculia bacterium]